MRAPIVALTLLFASLLLVAGCAGEEGSAPAGNGSTTTDLVKAPGETIPATTTPTTESGTPQATLTIINSAGEEVPVQVEIADTPAKRTRGLMGRTALAEDAGMLFVFDREQQLSFWMKNTLIPLSIAYIDAQRRIVDIQDMQPLDETPHPSAAPAQFALEVNQGFFAEHGIEVGNVLQ